MRTYQKKIGENRRFLEIFRNFCDIFYSRIIGVLSVCFARVFELENIQSNRWDFCKIYCDDNFIFRCRHIIFFLVFEFFLAKFFPLKAL